MGSLRKNKKRYEWVVYPSNEVYAVKVFRYKQQALTYLRSMGLNALDSVVCRYVRSLNAYYTHSVFLVKLNKQGVLCFKQYDNRKPIVHKISKTTVKYMSFTDKVVNLMTYLGHNQVDCSLSNLLILFKKRGLNLENYPDNSYVTQYVKTSLEDLPWVYWSDRCSVDRSKVIYNAIKSQRPTAFEMYIHKLNRYVH